MRFLDYQQPKQTNITTTEVGLSAHWTLAGTHFILKDAFFDVFCYF